MTYDFDAVYDRRRSDSEKWRRYPADVLPLWVADMDLRAPDPVVQALHERVAHGIFGYACDSEQLRAAVVERMSSLYGWPVAPEAVIFLAGVVQGFNLALHALASPGDGLLVQPPVYPPILKANAHTGMICQEAALTRCADGSYCVDLDAFERAITDKTRIFLLCNPHNPIGRVFRRSELQAMAEICLRRKILICSDEIHCDIIFNGYKHVPIASISPDIEQQTITLMAPSKTFNIAGLRLALAIVPNPALRKTICALQTSVMGPTSILSQVAALAAYRDGADWLTQALAYLEYNRDALFDYVQAHLPGVSMVKPESTFLGWLDCRQAGIEGVPSTFFLEKARVALNDGASFGREGAGFVRLNFGCPRSTMLQALDRLRQSLANLGAA